MYRKVKSSITTETPSVLLTRKLGKLEKKIVYLIRVYRIWLRISTSYSMVLTPSSKSLSMANVRHTFI